MLGPILALLGGRWWLWAAIACGVGLMVMGPIWEAKGLRTRVAEHERSEVELRAMLDEQSRRAAAGARALQDAREQVAAHIARQQRAEASVASSGDMERKLRRELDTLRAQMARRAPKSQPCDCAVDDALDVLRRRQQEGDGTPDRQ